MSALVLFAHGSRDPDWARPFRAVQENVAAQRPELAVELAFLEVMQPPLADAVRRLAHAGHVRITIAPLFMAQGAHLKRDLASIMAELRVAHPDIELALLPAAGEVPSVLEAVSAWLGGCRMKENRTSPLKSFAVALALLIWTSHACADLPQIVLRIAGHDLNTEVAKTDSDRSTGLMHRRMLPENRGMLFVFADVSFHAMWMMNTYVPLSVAFLDRDGVIINIEDMQPHTQTSHPAAKPAKYALEANQGWFRKRGIKPGDKVEGLEKAGAAK